MLKLNDSIGRDREERRFVDFRPHDAGREKEGRIGRKHLDFNHASFFVVIHPKYALESQLHFDPYDNRKLS